ncbi:MAG: hypothetical protein GY934_15640, partial [Gammaproteobacteria bacterium]|nr:hypothetical protein [Gammaproteobacteria bacterium]
MGEFRLKQDTHRRLIGLMQWLTLVGLGLVGIWNLLCLWLGLNVWWLAFIFPLPGLTGWAASLLAPRFLAKTTSPVHTYRLLYSTAPYWDDSRVRQALLTLIQSGVSLDIIWAYDAQEIGCWLAVSGHKQVLERMIPDILLNGSLEATPYPDIGQGVTVLHWQDLENVPEPAELCLENGVEGVYFRWQSDTAAIVAIWGARARQVADKLAQPGAVLPGQGQGLMSPQFMGDNPWPNLPRFPSSERFPGLSAVSRLERVAPGLRVNGRPALVVGQDSEGQKAGFALPNLDGMQLLRVVGQATNQVVIGLIQQAVQVNRPVMVLDGHGAIVTRLAHQLLREVATEKILICDVDRPAQSGFRLNPLWLPDPNPAWLKAMSSNWSGWLRELGVTPGGLGQITCQHTQAAVFLTALATTQRNLILDPPGLRGALLSPEFLTAMGADQVSVCRGVLDDTVWDWWLSEGLETDVFDTNLRLAHLRDRLGALLELPEYSVLWQGPYLNPLTAASNAQSLLWRLPDPRNRLAVYITSQLLA